mgnify:CR=1 FL=1
MKLRRILLIFAVAVLLCTAVCAGDYKDVADTHWASEQIAYLSDEITGYPDGTFQPDKTVTRAEFVSLLARIAFPEQLKNETGSTWWEPAFRVCEANNLLSGTYGYNEPMPRGEITRMLGYLCRDWGGVNARADASEQFVINWKEQRMESPTWKTLFSDTQGMDEDRYRVCANQGLMMGYPDGTFRPENGVTRAEAAVILARLKAQLALRKEGYDYVCTAGSNWLLTKTKGAKASLELMNPLTGDNKLTINFGFKVKTDNLAGWKLFSGSDGTYVWGEAGLYEREGNDIHLVCSEPVLDFVRSGDTYYVLTHPENEYPTYLYAAMYYPCATQVAAVDWDTNMTLLASRDESNNMQNLTDIYAENGKLYVAGAYCMGMMDVHCALYEVTDGKLTALFGES